MDDSEVTLNVCVGKQFTGGELFFRGVRCEKHVNTGTQSEVYGPFSGCTSFEDNYVPYRLSIL